MSKQNVVTVSFCDECSHGKDGEFCTKVDRDFNDDYPMIPNWCPLNTTITMVMTTEFYDDLIEMQKADDFDDNFKIVVEDFKIKVVKRT